LGRLRRKAREMDDIISMRELQHELKYFIGSFELGGKKVKLHQIKIKFQVSHFGTFSTIS